MHPEDAADHKEADPGTSFVTHRGSYSDFEGSDAGEAPQPREALEAAEEQSQDEDSEYEDDCEAEEDAYSDAFEVEASDEDVAESSSRDENPADLQSPSNAGNSSEGTGSPAAPVTAAVTIAPVSEPSESASQYSEPEEEEPKLEEPDEPDEPEDYSEDLEIEAEQGNDYYTPSEASDPRSDGRMDVRQSSIPSYDEEDIFEEDSGESLHPPETN
ncbi:unnamed protein product [Symbiodinium pilosum]|uniref:Uncharacterized protein n=1 Tax=Symbiodinium pilosum TaxID=2952 RepID=A0A812T1V9_SYMPI|nr:unnamed protein product [Symbiodinium pilosum]